MSKFFKKSLLYSLIGIAAVACTNVVPTPVYFESPNKQLAARGGGKPSIKPLVKNGDDLVVQPDTLTTEVIKNAQGEAGVHIFDFREVTPPDINFDFPSHSVVMMPVTYVGVDKGVANSFCEYWLYTKSGELVCYCKNTISGLHPVYGNSFNANNHLPAFTKKIGYGEYRLVYKNISSAPVKQDLIFGLIANNGKDQINTKVLSGETKEYWITIYPSTSEFKMNNNNKEPM
ncbi:hypothetical protein [Emticicia sp. C21]|uniref:hypothetical protein n=1 Tax=Emticicia sp. C21 TaxID=2302915 RepID=UPI000E3578F3|nr:hypothetical protein [Emticicia sp. C21]RFS16703.1 hypothetical protein D0T08_08455 [Emticicia sp. C21]